MIRECERGEIDGITVQYGKTTVQWLVDSGYSIYDFEQSIEEPVLTSCSLYKDNELVASLWFYDINEQISQEQLYNRPIDLILLEECPRRKEKPPSRKYARRKWGVGPRIFFSCLVHVALAAFLHICFLARRDSNGWEPSRRDTPTVMNQ